MSLSNNYPTTRPSLNLDFANTNMLDARVSFSRSSIATVTNSLGLLQTVQANVPRFDYDPVTLAPRGLLIEEQRTNLLTYSEDLTNAAWSQTGGAATISGNVAVAPDGATTADKIVSTVATSYGTRTPVFTSTAAAYTQSAFCKADGFNYVKFVWSSTQNATDYAVFNLTNGTVTGGVYTSASITPFGNGWYRCSITSTLAAVSTYSNIWMSDGTLSRGSGVAGDGTSGILVWGAQVELGAFATSYIPSTQTFTGRTSTGTFIGSNGLIQTASSGVARFQYNPLNLSVAPFLLLEAAATNLCLYSAGVGGTGWNNTNAGTGVLPVSTTNFAVAPDGTTTASRVQVSLGGGTTSTDQSITAQTLTGTSCRGSFYIKTNDGSSKTVYLRGQNAVSITVDGTWRRYDFDAGTLSGTQFGIGLRGGQTPTNSDTADLLVWGAQLETGSFPTSYIPTVATTVTRSADTSTSATTQRNADVASVNTLSPWYNATEGTLYAEYTPYVVTDDSRFVSIDNGTTASRIMFFGVSSSTRTIFEISNAAVSQVNSQATGTFTTNTTKAAGAYKVNDFAFSVNGTAALTDTSGSIPAVTQLVIGGAGGATPKIHGHIRKVAYYPVRLSNTNLQAITS